MDSKVSPRIELAIVHGIISLLAIFWLEYRLHLSSRDNVVLFPYALLVVLSSAVAYAVTGFFLSRFCSRLHFAWASIASLAVPAFASILAMSIYYMVGYGFAGPSHYEGFFSHMEVVFVIPLVFFYWVWPVTLAGTVAATALLIRKHRATNASAF